MSKRVFLALTAMMLTGASAPGALAPAAPGLWEVSHTAEGKNAARVCVADPASLAQWAHRGERCTRVVISDNGNKAVIHYTCTNGGFGRSDMTLLTPRTLRIATQGIAGNAPFNFVLHARRVGNCPGH